MCAHTQPAAPCTATWLTLDPTSFARSFLVAIKHTCTFHISLPFGNNLLCTVELILPTTMNILNKKFHWACMFSTLSLLIFMMRGIKHLASVTLQYFWF